MENNEFWKNRAKKYNNLEWVTNKEYLLKVISSAEPHKDDLVLDAGTGTGVVARAIAPMVKRVIAVDNSYSMLNRAIINSKVIYFYADIRKLNGMENNSFNKVIARMVFHHILDNTQKAMDECYRVLKGGGLMVLSEGVPPHRSVGEQYTEIFKLKEKRLTFFEEDLVQLMGKSGFIHINSFTVNLRISVKSWLGNSGLPKETQDKIYSMYKNGDENFKKWYAISEENDDCIINAPQVVLIGTKPRNQGKP
jgi:ubiquinone/menaquinone biosynthesis C-methylase UbiE